MPDVRADRGRRPGLVEQALAAQQSLVVGAAVSQEVVEERVQQLLLQRARAIRRRVEEPRIAEVAVHEPDVRIPGQRFAVEVEGGRRALQHRAIVPDFGRSGTVSRFDGEASKSPVRANLWT
jgi:hypothetical protein